MNGSDAPYTKDMTEQYKTLKTCYDCGGEFKPDEIRPYKYEPEIKLCDDCHDHRMDES